MIKVVTLADIVTADGKRITTNAWEFKQGNRLCNGHEWPKRPRAFTRQQIRIWKEKLHKAFGESTWQSKEIKQEFYLCSWIEDVSTIWTTYIDPITMRLYKRFDSGWKEFPVASFCTRRKKYQLIDGN